MLNLVVYVIVQVYIDFFSVYDIEKLHTLYKHAA